MSGGGKGGGSQTIGYHYFFSLLIGIGRGPINYLKAIKIGDKEAWSGTTTGSSVDTIDRPELFGGEKKEGGVQGPFRLFTGDRTQVLPGATPVTLPAPYGGGGSGLFGGLLAALTGLSGPGTGLPSVKESLGGLVSEFRGAATLWFDGLICSINPYPKEWKLRIVRHTAGWFNNVCWFPAYCVLNLAADYLSVDVDSAEITLELNPLAGSATITFVGNGNDGNTISINGSTITLKDSGAVGSDFEVNIGATGSITASRVASMISANPDYFNVVAGLGGNVIGLGIRVGSNSISAMNGAHIVYECCTNPEWGRGLPDDMMDGGEGATFRAAAVQLWNEGLGLCIAWHRKEEIDDFIKTVLDHIGAALYTDRRTGKVCLKLIRGDYFADDLRMFSPENGLLSIEEDDSAASDQGYNEVIVTGHDPVTDEDIQARAHNLAARQAQGAASTMDSKYPGLPTLALCGRIAQRDLEASASGLKKFSVKLDRRGFDIYPGHVFRVRDPRRGLEGIVLRAGDIEDGNMVNGEITIKAMQDVFSVPDQSFSSPVNKMWTPPSTEAVPPSAQQLFELSYRDLFRKLSPGDLSALSIEDGYAGTVASAPTFTSIQYDLLTRVDGEPEFVNRGSVSFTGSGTIVGGITATATALQITNVTALPQDMIGDSLLVGNEIMRIDAWTPGTSTFTVARGCVDTLPQAHAGGTPVFLPDDDYGSDLRVYSDGEPVEAKLLTRTSADLLTEAEATLLTLEIDGRQGRPYPPANIIANGVPIFTGFATLTEPTFTWVERNRVTQQDQLVGWFEGSIAAEAGTTYRMKIYDAPFGGAPIATRDGIVSPFTYTTAMQTVDSPPSIMWVEIVAVRDGLESWKPPRFRAPIDTGYGLGYGLGYGQ